MNLCNWREWDRSQWKWEEDETFLLSTRYKQKTFDKTQNAQRRMENKTTKTKHKERERERKKKKKKKKNKKHRREKKTKDIDKKNNRSVPLEDSPWFVLILFRANACQCHPSVSVLCRCVIRLNIRCCCCCCCLLICIDPVSEISRIRRKVDIDGNAVDDRI